MKMTLFFYTWRSYTDFGHLHKLSKISLKTHRCAGGKGESDGDPDSPCSIRYHVSLRTTQIKYQIYIIFPVFTIFQEQIPESPNNGGEEEKNCEPPIALADAPPSSTERKLTGLS